MARRLRLTVSKSPELALLRYSAFKLATADGGHGYRPGNGLQSHSDIRPVTCLFHEVSIPEPIRRQNSAAESILGVDVAVGR